MRVLGFSGGGSVRVERLRLLLENLGRERGGTGLLVVVAAPAVVRAELSEAVRQAAAGDGGYEDTVARVLERFRAVAAELLPEDEGDALEPLLVDFEERAADLRDLLHAAFLLRDGGDRLTDGVLAQGELAYARLVTVVLCGAGIAAEMLDPRPLLVSDAEFGAARVEHSTTRARVAALLPGGIEMLVTAGGVAATSQGETTSLGLDGGVASAAAFALAVDADRLELWLEGVSGLELEASSERRLSFGELGALVQGVFPLAALEPLARAGLGVTICDLADPHGPPLQVEARPASPEGGVRGLAVEPSLAHLRLEGDDSRFDTGFSARLLASLAFAGVEVRGVARPLREAALTVLVTARDASRARRVFEDELEMELASGQLRLVEAAGELGALMVVGEGLGAHAHTLAAVLAAVAADGAVLSGMSLGQRGLALLVERQRLATLVPAVRRHLAGVASTPIRRLRIAVAGDGRVARALLGQLRSRRAELARQGLELELVARWSSRRLAFDAKGLDPARWTAELSEERAGALTDPERVREALLSGDGPGVLVDLTASDAVPALYARWLAAGQHVVAANKRAFAGPLERYRAILAAAEAGAAQLRHEATVGAGLPVLSTLEDLLATGDAVTRIDGVLSGTVSFVLDRVGAGEPLSKAVRAAHEAGLTEPHPAEDLLGTDVARKLVILARRAGVDLELEDVTVESLSPGGLDQPLDEFWRTLPSLDDRLAERAREAHDDGRRLRYVARLELGERPTARVAVEAVAADHPAHGLAGPDNLIAFSTARYAGTPLVVRGPGAGPEVTAAGVFADLLRLVPPLPAGSRPK